jgi:Bacterial Ig-like domain
MNNAVKKLLFLVLMLVLIPQLSSAAGVSTHFAMGRAAIEKVSDPELKALLENNKDAVMCGEGFPDFGTAVDYGTLHRKKFKYGSQAHKMEFVEAYFDYVKDKCGSGGPGCDRLIAHFMGTAAHSTQDDLYDELFMNKAEALDPDGADKHDLWADELFIVEYDPLHVTPRYYLPKSDLMIVYTAIGQDVRKKDLKVGKFYHWLGAAALRTLALVPYPTYSKKMSFTKANIVSHPGGVDHTSAVTADYWEILWKRLHDEDEGELVLETWPEHGASDHAYNHNSLYSRVSVFFTTGMDQTSITEKSFYLEDPDGNRVPATYRIKHDHDNFAALVPLADLKPGESYKAVLTTDVKDMKGNNLKADYSWTFTTSVDPGPE